LLGVLTVSGKNVAVKTGTSNDFKDALTLGYTPSLVAGVWAGNNNGDEMDHGGGSTAAAPIWHDFMAKALKSKGNEPFFRPSSISDPTVDFLSSKKPTPASGQLVQDVFAPWQIPTKDDDVHVSVKVCKSNGLLATDATPPDEVEDRVFTRVHSERPDNPAWEGPVQAWARDQGLNPDVPTEKCTIIFTDPKVKITNPASGNTVSGIFTVAADVTFPPDTSGSVEFLVDDSILSTDQSEPFTATLDASTLSTGSHSLTAIARSSNGGIGRDIINITVQHDTTTPGETTNVTVTPGSPSKALVSWTNPLDSDLALIAFYVSQSAGIKGAKHSSISASPGSNQTITLGNLVSGKTNYITLAPTDTSGNSNPTTKQYSVFII
jgi:membrane carboxypeptidase/penicillin-binding protein PbpC